MASRSPEVASLTEAEAMNSSASSTETDDIVVDLSSIVMKDQVVMGDVGQPANTHSGPSAATLAPHIPAAGLHKSESTYYDGKSMVKDARLMDDIPAEREITLTFDKICSWVPNLLFGQAKKAAKKSASEGKGEPPAKRQVLVICYNSTQHAS